MATFGELMTKVSKRLKDANNTAVDSSDVGDAINAALAYWKQKRFWFNEHEETVTLIAGNKLLPALSVNLLYLLPRYGMTIPYQSYTYQVRNISPDDYDSMDIGTAGRPYAYTWRGGRYELYYYPDQAYTVNVIGVKDYEPLVNSGDMNDFTEYADQLIMYDALSRLFAEFRTDPEMSEYYTNRTRDEENNLNSRTRKMLSTGRLHIDRILTKGDHYA
jgi:hypothetical protein